MARACYPSKLDLAILQLKKLLSTKNAIVHEHITKSFWQTHAVHYGLVPQTMNYSRCSILEYQFMHWLESSNKSEEELQFWSKWGKDIQTLNLDGKKLLRHQILLALELVPNCTTLICSSLDHCFDQRELLDCITRVSTLHVHNCKNPTLRLNKVLPFSSIQKLEFTNCIELHLTRLPSSLKELSIKKIHTPFCLTLSILPPTIESLLCDDTVHINSNEFVLFPKSLKKLSLNIPSMLSKKLFSSLQLEELHLRKTDVCIDYLPKSLLSLTLSKCHWNELNFEKDHIKISHLDVKECEYNMLTLPHSLQKFSIDMHSLQSMEKHYLKKCNRLKKLEILNFTYHNSLTHFLPYTIDSLSFIKSNNLNDSHLQELDNFHNLEELNLSQCYQIRGSGLIALPKGLKKLLLKNCNRLSGHTLAYLPETLEHLDIEGCELVEQKDMYHLPKTLKHLNITNCPKLIFSKKVSDYLEKLHVLKANEYHCIAEELVTFAGRIETPSFTHNASIPMSKFQTLLECENILIYQTRKDLESNHYETEPTVRFA